MPSKTLEDHDLMNFSIYKQVTRTVALLVLLSLSACSGSDDESSSNNNTGGTTAGNTDGGGSTDVNTTTGVFTLSEIAAITLEEGNPAGANIAVVLTRLNGHNKPISLTIAGATDADDRLITIGLFPEQLAPDVNYSSINLGLAIDDLPIMPQERTFYIDASDGDDTARTTVQVNVTPVDAPDVYLLAGQSNMVGFSGDGTKLAMAGGPDEPNPRIFQLNVTKNDQFDVFTTKADFTSESNNAIVAARIVQAEDPLHVPIDPTNSSSKDRSYIGMGMSFAKAALNNTTQNIILVPTAWSGSAFCANEQGPPGQWNPQTSTNPNLGNTWLFDRAITRTNLALTETSGILRGILWHQGESDSNNASCAAAYQANLERLAKQFRLQISADQRGGDLRRDDANIPFVVGTMSRGIDERGDLSEFWFDKQLVDDAHRTLPSKVAHAAVSISDDLIPSNGYPCGNTTCIHYGAAAFREMGERYYDALLRAVANRL